MKKNGFTIIELLIVVAIMAIVATLATGAAMKAVKQGRIKRIETTAKVIEMAIMNYRTQKGSWPFKRPGGSTKGDFVADSSEEGIFWIHGGKGSKAGSVYALLYKNGYLDGSGILCSVGGIVKRLNTIAKSEASSTIQIGYPNPQETSEFDFYCIKFNAATETVHLFRQDVYEDNPSQLLHKCPKYHADN